MSDPLYESVEGSSQADWVEATRLSILMKGMEASQRPALLVLAVLTGLCWGHVSVWLIAGVLAISIYVAVVRTVFLRGYARVTASGTVSQQLAYVRDRAWFWIVNPIGWGVWPLAFHGRLPAQSEVVCWMLIAGVGGVAIAWMSAHLRLTRIFLLTYLGGVTVSVALAMVIWPDTRTSMSSLWFPVVLGGYWLLLLRISKYLSEVYGKNIDLTYQNAILIHSLREQKRTVEDALRFKEHFMAGAAHDLKQPVSALGIYSELLNDEPGLVDELGPKILRSTRAINALFDSMFDLAKLDAGDYLVKTGSVHVVELFEELAAQFAPVATTKGLALRVRPVQAKLHSDPVMLRRIIGNLLGNAIRYTAEGSVLLSARCRPDRIVFEVWDTGRGIAPHEQARIFDEFYQVNGGAAADGFGLGLAIVRRLSERLGYSVSLNSREGRGSVFRVSAPLALPAPVSRSAGHSYGQSAMSVSGS